MTKWLRELQYGWLDLFGRSSGAESDDLVERLRVRLNSEERQSQVEDIPTWVRNVAELRRLARRHDPANFLRWRVIRRAMFVSTAPYTPTQLEELRRSGEWDRWREAVAEPRVGNPIVYRPYPDSSANLIHQAYHLRILEKACAGSVEDFDLIIEVGGGYGALASVAFRAGYSGCYAILDLPEFSALQEYYLSQMENVEVCWEDEFGEWRQGGTILVSSPSARRELTDLVSENPGRTLFIATWSLSEMPLKVREDYEPLMHGADSFLFAFQDAFEGVDNLSYFSKLTRALSHVHWIQRECPEIPNNYYLMGCEI